MSNRMLFHRGSPRTQQEPMAFTTGELLRGGFMALLVFNLAAPVLTAVALAVIPLLFGQGSGFSDLGYLLAIVMYTPLYAAPWSLGALLLAGLPLAHLLGRRLRRTTSWRIQLGCFAALGLLVGAGTMVLWAGIGYQAVAFGLWELIVQGLPMILLFAALSSVSVASGWHLTAKWALRDDALDAAAA